MKLVIETLVLIQELALDRTQLPPSQRERPVQHPREVEQKGDLCKSGGDGQSVAGTNLNTRGWGTKGQS